MLAVQVATLPNKSSNGCKLKPGVHHSAISLRRSDYLRAQLLHSHCTSATRENKRPQRAGRLRVCKSLERIKNCSGVFIVTPAQAGA